MVVEKNILKTINKTLFGQAGLFLKLIIIFSCSSLLTFDFNGNLQTMEANYYPLSLTDANKSQFISLGNQLIQNANSCPDQGTWSTFISLLQNAVYGYKFQDVTYAPQVKNLLNLAQGTTPSYNATATAIKTTTTSTATVSSYTPLADRLNNFIRVMAQAFDPNQANNYYILLNNWYLPELYGDPNQATIFIMAIRSLSQKCATQAALSSMTSQLTQLQQQVQSFTLADRIGFLQRLNINGAFTAANEQTLFMKTTVDLVNGIASLNSDQMQTLYALLVQATGMSNFSNYATQLQGLSSSVLSAWNNSLASNSNAGSATTTSVTNTTASPDTAGFTGALSQIQSDINKLSAQYDSTDWQQQATALQTKTKVFTNLDNLVKERGDMLIAEMYSNNLLTLGTDQKQWLDQNNALTMLGQASYKRVFASDKTKLNAYINALTTPLNVEEALVNVERIQQQAIATEEQPRYILQLDWLVRKAIAQAVSSNQLGRLKNVILTAQGNEFANDTRLNTLLSKLPAISSNTSSTTGTSSLTGAVAAHSVLADGQVISLRFDTPSSADMKFWRTQTDPSSSNTLLYASNGGLMDASAHFKVKLSSDGNSFELWTTTDNRRLQYTPSLATIQRDLIWNATPTTADLQAGQFYLIPVAGTSTYNIVNAVSMGYVTLLPNETLVTTDFVANKPLGSTPNSAFTFITLNSLCQSLASLKNANDDQRVQNYSSLMNGIASQQDARIWLREIGLYILGKHSDSATWQAFQSSANYTILQNLISSISQSKRAQYFTNLDIFIQQISDIFTVAQQNNLILTPLAEKYFWMVDSSFIPLDGNNFRVRWSMKANDTFEVGFHSESSKSQIDQPLYVIKFADSNNQQIDIWKNNQKQASAVFTLSGTQYQDFSIEYANGTLTVYNNNPTPQSIVSWQDPTSPASSIIMVGFSVINQTAYLDDIFVEPLGATSSGTTPSGSTSTTTPSSTINLTQQSYNQIVTNIQKRAQAMRSIDLTILNDLLNVSLVQNRLAASSAADLTLLNQTFLYTKNSVFYRNNTQATNLINQITQALAVPVDWNTQENFLWALYQQMKVYSGQPNAIQANLNNMLNVFMNNLQQVVSISYDSSKQSDVSSLLSYAQYDPLFSNQQTTLTNLANSLSNVFQIVATPGTNLLDRITLHASVLPRLTTTAQRASFNSDVEQSFQMVLAAIMAAVKPASNAGTASSANATIPPTAYLYSIPVMPSGFTPVPGQVELKNCISQMMNSPFFGDVMGSLQYWTYILNGNGTLDQQIAPALIQLNAGQLTTQNFITQLTQMANTTWIPMLNKGLIQPDHQPILTNMVNFLTQLRNQNSTLNQMAANINNIIFQCTVGADLTAVANNLLSNLNKITSISDAMALVSIFDKNMVAYFENLLQVGSATQANRDAVNAVLTAALQNTWFIQASLQGAITALQSRMTAQISIAMQINQLNNTFNNLPTDQPSVQQFVNNLKALSTALTAAVSTGQFNQADLTNFNALIDTIIQKTTGTNLAGGYYLLSMQQQYANLNLTQLKITPTAGSNFNLRLSALSAALNNLTTPTSIAQFMQTFDALMVDWRLANLLTPNITQDPALISSFNTFFQNALANYYLLSSQADLQEAQDEIADGIIDPQAEVGILTTYFNSPQAATQTPAILFGALNTLCNHWIGLKNISFSPLAQQNALNALLTTAAANPALATYASQIQALITKVGGDISMDSKVAALNVSLNKFLSYTNAQISNNQVNIVSNVITQAISALRALQPGQVSAANCLALQTAIQNMLGRSTLFSTTQQANLQDALTVAQQLVSSAPQQVATAPTTSSTSMVPGSYPNYPNYYQQQSTAYPQQNAYAPTSGYAQPTSAYPQPNYAATGNTTGGVLGSVQQGYGGVGFRLPQTRSSLY